MGIYVKGFEEKSCDFSDEIAKNLDYSIVNDSILFEVYSRILDIILSIIGLIIVLSYNFKKAVIKRHRNSISEIILGKW